MAGRCGCPTSCSARRASAGCGARSASVRRRRSLALPACRRLAGRLRGIAPAARVVSRVPDLHLAAADAARPLRRAALPARARRSASPAWPACSTSRPSSTCRTTCSRARRRPACCSPYLWWSTPQFLYYIIAIAVLLAAIVTIGALTKSSELIVMRACGISLYRTARAAARVAAIGASAVLFALEEQLLGAGQPPRQPAGPSDSRPEPADLRRPQPQVAHRRRRRALPLPVLQPARARAERPHRAATSPTRRSDRVAVARLARSRRRPAPVATGARGRRASGWTRTFDATIGGAPSSRASTRPVLTLETPETFVTEAPPPSQMNYGQLRTYVARAAGQRLRRARGRSGAPPQDRLPVRHAGHDAHRRAVRRHDRPARRALRRRRRASCWRSSTGR